MDEFKQIFFTECSELLADMEAHLLELQEGVHDAEKLNAIFRAAHSIKGGSGAFGLDAIMHFTHTQEALLDHMRDGTLLPTRAMIDTLLKSADTVNQMLEAEKKGAPLPADYSTALIAQLQSFMPGAHAIPAPKAVATAAVIAPAAPAGPQRYQIRFAPHAGLFINGNDPLLLLHALGQLGTCLLEVDGAGIPAWDAFDPTQCYLAWNITLETTQDEDSIHEIFDFVNDVATISISRVEEKPADIVPPVATPTATAVIEPAAAAPAANKAAAASSGAGSIRVDLEKLDRLVNMVGELVITEAMLRAQLKDVQLEQFAGLLRGLDELSHHTRELQEAVMSVRMQPVKSIFSRMPRIVRDTAAQLGKDVQLILSGENTEVDKTVIEQLGDPLTHMIRNCLDHGIESPDQRVWNDKPLQGTIHLSAYHRSGRIVIEIQDDGAGINRVRVLGKAQEKGLVAEDAQLSDEEIDNLIFLPGFSTVDQVTSVSGRGVGMDVVKRNIEAIGGTVRITNMPTKGSIFTISLPLTLAILDGMVVRIGAETYIIPITSILETLRPRPDTVHRVQEHGDVIKIRGEFVPLVYLHHMFQIPGASKELGSTLVVLVECGKHKLGLVVDELIGQQQVVIKSLEANTVPVKGISGATILGDGNVSLIFEVNEIYTLWQQMGGYSQASSYYDGRNHDPAI
jgi:two-component system chemotaxis sensor kinase CheA